jgi:hypothetical protein
MRSVLMLIETRDPSPPSPQPGRGRPTWPLTLLRLSWRLLAGVGLVLLSSAFPPIEAYGLLIAACVLIARGLGTIVQSTTGLQDHRQ